MLSAAGLREYRITPSLPPSFILPIFCGKTLTEQHMTRRVLVVFTPLSFCIFGSTLSATTYWQEDFSDIFFQRYPYCTINESTSEYPSRSIILPPTNQTDICFAFDYPRTFFFFYLTHLS